MSTVFRRSWMLAPLVLAGLVAGLAANRPAAPATGQSGGPAAWTDLPVDAIGECATEPGRDGVGSAWAIDNGYLHLRLCLAGQPGWDKVAGANGPTWTDARYKWRISSGNHNFLLLLEDAALVAGATPGSMVVAGDGMGDLTLLHDMNGNGRFSDDWATSSPPQYLSNGARSPQWRRAWATNSGPNQQANAGDLRDIGFRFGQAPCGPVIDVWVNTAVLGGSKELCAGWFTDPEAADLDARPACDSGPGITCLSDTEPNPTAPPVIATDTRVPSATPVPPSSTPLPTATSVPPTETSVPPTATEPAPTASPVSATATNPPATSIPPTATSVPPSATPLVGDETPTATQPSTATPPSSPPSATPIPASATPGSGAATATPAPTWTPIVVTRTPTPDLVPVTPPWASPTVTPFPTSSFPTPSGPPTQVPGTAGLGVCVLDVDPNGQNPRPFPFQVVVHAQLLTPYGAPAAPPMSRYVDPTTGGCTTYAGIEPGSYRTWVSNVPSNYMLFPGTPQTQTVQCLPAPAQYAQVAFRYTICSYCQQPTPYPGQPGVPPPPPGPPGQWPTPTLSPWATFTPPAPPPGGLTPPPPPGPPGGEYPKSPDRPPFGCQSLLPILNFLGNDPVCSTWVEAQNIGDRPAKALMLVWGAPGFCPPQCTGPLKIECSGLLTPGSAWNFLGSQMPAGAKSGAIVSAGIEQIGFGQDIFADALCEALFQTVVGDCGEYRRFWKAYTEHGAWGPFDFGYLPCQPMAVEVLRTCPGDVRPDVTVTSSYTGVAGEFLGAYDPVFGGFAFYAPSLYAGSGGYNSILYIQNGGLECTSLELWFKGHDDCLRPRICDVLTLAPGETYQFDVSSCLPQGWVGNAWIRSTQPLGVAVDHTGNDVLMTYTGMPSELNYSWNGQAFYTTGSAVAYGPLIYSEYQGWDSAVIVQNMSRTSAAKVKVYFLDRSGDVITTVVDWVCAQGAQQFYLPVIAGLPGNWVGSVRVESQDWFAPGSSPVAAPNISAVAELVKYTDVMRTEPQEAIAYDLFPEQMAYDWQVGSYCGGLCSGIGRIGIPSFHKDSAGTGVTSEVSIANIVPVPGFTDFAIFIYDQNGLLDYVCEKLHSRQVEYIDLNTWGFINPGFKGSSIISATFWEHDVFDGGGNFVRNVVGLAAVKVERSGTAMGNQVPGDESAGNIGFPLPGPMPCNCAPAPRCPGQPSFGGGGGGGGAQPTLPPPPPPPPPAPQP
ncbi:MAG: hypothetical protein KDH92_03635 [Chloroflexi bacterium]|nr:hypothetical protein [Chloroflexota bacterium]